MIDQGKAYDAINIDNVLKNLGSHLTVLQPLSLAA